MNSRIKSMNPGGAGNLGALNKTFRGTKVWLSYSVLAVAAMGFWGCGDDPVAEPTLTIETPANGSTVAGPKVLLKVKTTLFSFAGGAAAKASAAQHDEDIAGGHVHVFLDKPAGLDADAVVSLSKYDTATITIATAGWHYIIVQGANANHDDVESMRDSVMFTVNLP